MKNAVIINCFENMGAEIRHCESFIEALEKLDIFQPYKITAEIGGCIFRRMTESKLKEMLRKHRENVEHDIEEMTYNDAESWEKWAYTIRLIRLTENAKQALMVRRIGDNDFIFYAEKAINLGYSVNAITDAYQLDDDEEPFTTEFSSSETYFNFESLENALHLEKDEMAMFGESGEIVITEKDRELLKSEGIQATETNFTDFLDRIDETGAAFMGYLNNHLYFC